MVDLAGELIAAALRHDALGSRRGLFAHLLLGRAACIASIALSADHRRSRDLFRRFHSVRWDLFSTPFHLTRFSALYAFTAKSLRCENGA
jgi:hypothetical protein